MSELSIQYNLISTCAGECDWLFHWQHKLCATFSMKLFLWCSCWCRLPDEISLYIAVWDIAFRHMWCCNTNVSMSQVRNPTLWKEKKTHFHSSNYVLPLKFNEPWPVFEKFTITCVFCTFYLWIVCIVSEVLDFMLFLEVLEP
jgi:hypothetical protein